ncbi:hypothetical protein BASA81_002451 [Batrachochytrium salamandrivorans]|nr:hypothetical protein BASA81_002451 [Batrachochytrium salamandrivorans]
MDEDVDSISGREEEEHEVEVVDPEEEEEEEGGGGEGGGDGEEDEEEEEEEEEDDGEEEEDDDEDYNDGNRSALASPSPPPMSSLQNSPIISTTPPPMPTPQLISTAAKKSTRPRRSSSTISAPTGGKPKFYSQNRGEDEDEDEEDGLPAAPPPSSSSMQEPKKRAQTFGNTNTATAETLLQQTNRPFKNLDISQKLRVQLRGDRSSSSGAANSMSTSSTITGNKDEAKYNIPAPVAAAASAPVASSASSAPAKQASPVYIRLQQEWLQPHDYEITVEDELWLSASAHCSGTVAHELFERIINQFEILTGAVANISLTSARAFSAVTQPLGRGAISRQASDELFQYWCTKRNKNKRSLLRRFWVQPTEDNRNATSTFIMREFENRYKLRKKRMNDLESYEKLLLLKKDFERMYELAVMADKREVLKRLEVDLVHAEYLEKLATACSAGQALSRPACLDVPLPDCPELEPMENAYMYLDPAQNQPAQPQPRHRSSSHHKSASSSFLTASSSTGMLGSSHGAGSGGGGGASGYDHKKKSHKRKLPGDDGYVASTIQPGTSLSTNPIPFYFPEALYFRDDPVPLPLFLLGDSRLLLDNPYKLPTSTTVSSTTVSRSSKLPKLDLAVPALVPRLGRNRRRALEQPTTSDGGGETVRAAEPSLATRQRLAALLSSLPDEDNLVVIERMDLALLRGNEGAVPKFQLLA